MRLLTFGPILLGVACTMPVTAQPGRVSSAYTKLDLEKCARVDAVAEHQSARWRCSGYKGVSLFVQNGDDRYDVDAGREDLDEFWSAAFDYPGATVEWRLSAGTPFAIIYWLIADGDGAPRSSTLIVETVGRGGPGCRVATIAARSAEANELARRAADGVLRGTRRCMAAGSARNGDR